jgi:hypothetical protein
MKGDYNQECNRTACNNLEAVYYNHSTRKYYCPVCAFHINEANRADAQRLYGHELCLPIRRELDRPELKNYAL